MNFSTVNKKFKKILKTVTLDELELVFQENPFEKMVEKIDEIDQTNLLNGLISYRDFLSLIDPRFRTIFDIRLFQNLQSDDFFRRIKVKDLKRLLQEWQFFLYGRYCLLLFSPKSELEMIDRTCFTNWMCKQMEEWSMILDLSSYDKLFLAEAFTEKCFFFLSSNNKNQQIKINDFLMSPCFTEVFLVVHDETFSVNPLLDWARDVWTEFVTLDTNKDNGLSKEEFAPFLENDINPRLIDKMFDCCQNPNQMKFDEFIRFSLALENIDNIHGARFFFPLLCLDGNSYIDEAALRYFVMGNVIAYKTLEEEGTDTEIGEMFVENLIPSYFDMTCPINLQRITLNDILNSHCAVRFFTTLITVKFCCGTDKEKDEEDDQETQTIPKQST